MTHRSKNSKWLWKGVVRGLLPVATALLNQWKKHRAEHMKTFAMQGPDFPSKTSPSETLSFCNNKWSLNSALGICMIWYRLLSIVGYLWHYITFVVKKKKISCMNFYFFKSGNIIYEWYLLNYSLRPIISAIVGLRFLMPSSFCVELIIYIHYIHIKLYEYTQTLMFSLSNIEYE